jgi:uncharacterized membrane protein YedE/YeeE
MNNMIDFLSQPWPWYISGPLIALVMFLLLRFGGNFGVSATLRSMCSMAGAGKHCDFFDFNWKSQRWNLIFALGAVVGGFIASTALKSTEPLALNPNTIEDLSQLGIYFTGEMVPMEIFSWNSLLTIKGFVVLIVGGFLVGFGTRWAGGCTSGHAISGLSDFQLPSLIAVIGFFIGGLVMTFLIFPILF